MNGARDARRIAVGLVACLLLSSLVGAAGIAVAGDQLAVIAPEPHDVDAEPGEEFEVDVVVRSQGGHGGEGVAEVILVTQYHPDYLEITDIEAGPWLEQGEDTEIVEERRVDHDAGTAILEQRRDPVAGGATGTDVIATLTVSVAEDAPPSEATISFGDSQVNLEGEWPLAIHDQDLTVSIDGGGDLHESFDHPDPAEVTHAEDANTNASEDGSESDDSSADAGNGNSGAAADSTDEDPISGFGTVATAVAIGALATAVAFRTRQS